MDYPIIEHAGVKGMKWGVRKAGKAVASVARAAVNQRVKTIRKRQAKLDAYHDSNKKNKSYKADYNLFKNMHKGNERQRHYKAIKTTRTVRRQFKAILATSVGLAVTSGSGKAVIQKMSKVATSPEAARLGKNIIQAAKRSPVRYVDGSTMKNVVRGATNALVVSGRR